MCVAPRGRRWAPAGYAREPPAYGYTYGTVSQRATGEGTGLTHCAHLPRVAVSYTRFIVKLIRNSTEWRRYKRIGNGNRADLRQRNPHADYCESNPSTSSRHPKAAPA